MALQLCSRYGKKFTSFQPEDSSSPSLRKPAIPP
jgi:hypothetical protein